MTRDEIVALARACRAVGVRRLKTADIELELMPELPDPPSAQSGSDESDAPPPVATPEFRSALDIMLGDYSNGAS